jgi:hypothetical protein
MKAVLEEDAEGTCQQFFFHHEATIRPFRK